MELSTRIETGSNVVELLRGLNLSCTVMRRRAEHHGMVIIRADMGDLPGALLGDVIAVNLNCSEQLRAFAKLHGLYHALRAGGPIVLPL